MALTERVERGPRLCPPSGDLADNSGNILNAADIGNPCVVRVLAITDIKTST